MVHQDRQDRDYTLIKENDPLFLTLDGETMEKPLVIVESLSILSL